MSVPNLERIALFLQKLLGGSQNFEILSRDPDHADLGFRGRFMVPIQEGSVLHLRTKFEADCSILSKVNKGVQKFGN